MRLVVTLAIILCCLSPDPGRGQEHTFASLLQANSHEVTMDSGVLAGDGFDLLLDAAQGTQFFAIAEEHNEAALNELATILFAELQRQEGYQYLALEQGSVITSWLGGEKCRGNIDAITDLIGAYPHAPTFATDEELDLIATVGKTSAAKPNPIWGIDQELGALHILERLAVLAPNQAAADIVNELAVEARKHELDRFGEIHYMSQVLVPADLSELPDLFRAASGDEAGLLIEALQRSSRIYYNHTMSRQGQLTAYENAREREHSMKLRFMEQYRTAQAAGDPLPRVLAKMGHWHILRGIYRSNMPTFGNFLSEFSISNELDTFVLSTYVIDSEESWRNTGGVLADVALEGVFTVIDLRPLRPYAHQNKITDLSDYWHGLLFKADAVLIIRGGHTGGYSIVKQGK